jgi:hypothetical protein
LVKGLHAVACENVRALTDNAIEYAPLYTFGVDDDNRRGGLGEPIGCDYLEVRCVCN